jgi:hypothetical protein
MQIFVSQQYSFILTADQPVDNYWVRAQPSSGNTTFIGGLNSHLLPNPPLAQYGTNPLVETDLHPLESPAATVIPIPGAADVTTSNLTRQATCSPLTTPLFKNPPFLCFSKLSAVHRHHRNCYPLVM